MRNIVLLVVLFLAGIPISAFAQNSRVPASYISATPLDKAVQLTWSAFAENTVSFVLEKSRNGVVYDTITSGQTFQVNTDHIETDFSPYEGTSWYRLRMTDAAGNVSYSNVVPVRFLQGNPIPLFTPLVESSKEDDTLLVVVTDNTGNEYYSKVIINIDGNPVLATDLENRLHSGCYQIVACSDQNFYSRSLTVR
ncbi:MAG: hypothetical protein IM638_02220 [Bacteroidetes bacterium]|nr:hypothetical protein [Bacteroidota bacterium]